MAELSVKKLETLVPTSLDGEGRPYCPEGCGQVMTEVAPGQFRCPDGLVLQTAMRECITQLAAAAFEDASGPSDRRNLIDFDRARRPGAFAALGALRMPRAEQSVDVPFGLLPVELDPSVPRNEIRFRSGDQAAAIKLDEECSA